MICYRSDGETTDLYYVIVRQIAITIHYRCFFSWGTEGRIKLETDYCIMSSSIFYYQISGSIPHSITSQDT